ncbi:MAG: AMP-binding protein [Blastocatellia bacterium]
MRSTLLSFLEDDRNRAEETAVVSRHGLRTTRATYGEMASTAHRFARELEARGIGKGDRVLFWAENSAEWIAAFFGCVLRGAVAVPIDRQSAPDFVLRVQQQVSAKLLLCGREVLRVNPLPLPALLFEDFDETIGRHAPSPYPRGEIGADDLVEIIFTSGTTAEPKGVCLTHRNFLSSLAPLEEEIGKYLRWERFVHPLRFLSLLPLSHVFGQFMGIFVPRLLGAEVHFRASFNPSTLIEAIRTERINVVATFPRMLETLAERIEREYEAPEARRNFQRAFEAAADQPVLRRWWTFRRVHRRFGWRLWAFISGGAPLSEEAETFWQRLGYAVIQGYGMTETASIISLPHPFKLVHGSIGKAMPGQEVTLGENGEILIRGENVSPGYWRGGPTALTDEAGWLHTRDIGERDAEGNIFFRGRKKDVIVTAAGMKVHPEDVEEALNRQPEIRESVVGGVETPRGAEPMAALILADERARAEEAVQRANRTLAPHQQIRHWEVWPDSDFPRTTTTQKVIRRLVAQAMKERMQPGARSSAPPSSFVLQQIARISGAAPAEAAATANLATDLKLDSLGRVELLSALEDRYQIDLDESAFTAATTLGEIRKMIHEAPPETSPYPYPAWPRAFPATWIRRAVLYLLVLPLTRLLCPMRVAGRDHLGDLAGQALFVSNHVTAIDPALILYALPARFRNRMAIAMLGEFLRDWSRPLSEMPADLGMLTRLRLRIQYVLVTALFNVFPLPQQSGFRRSFAFAGELIDRGCNVMLFPEGARTPDGRLHPFMNGTGLLAEKLGVPIVPIRIDGLYELKAQGRRIARPGDVTLRIGAPLRFARETPPAEITRAIEDRIAALEG